MVLRLSKLAFSEATWLSCGFTANKSSSELTDFCFCSVLFKILFASDLNSNSAKISLSFCSSGAWSCNSSRLSSTGTSVRIVARNFDILISSMAPSTFSRILPFSLSVCEMSSSMEPNSLISFTAVFSPTPGQPGKLSAESPIKASKSITWAGVEMPYFSAISCSPMMS